jgi:AraC-like DNA-binding protein
MAWSTREIAELAGTSLRAVRHYHEVGLLAEPERRANGYKQYGVAHLIRVLRIKRLTDDDAWAVHFLPDVVPALASVSPLAWERHPLLRTFHAEIVSVPGPERDHWHGWFESLADEVAHPERVGAPDAMVAILTRILVAAARLVPDPSSSALDPLLVRVFDQVESMFREPVSAGDVARELGYTPGHLTTVVRERSGRTVGEWLTARRLTEARRLLLETDLPLGAVAARTGLSDGAYLGRRFRDRYGTSPDRWRRERRVSPR